MILLIKVRLPICNNWLWKILIIFIALSSNNFKDFIVYIFTSNTEINFLNSYNLFVLRNKVKFFFFSKTPFFLNLKDSGQTLSSFF